MKRSIYIFILPALLLLGCAEDFLDDNNLYEKSNVNYYSTPEDFDEAIAGVYSSMPFADGTSDPFIWAKLMSDDAFGGGGADNIPDFHAIDGFKEVTSDVLERLFSNYWPGILRANLILSKVDDAEYSDENRKKQVKGEALFMRAFYYFTLSKFFGPVPLKLEPTTENLPRATVEEMYGQIASDLKTAIENMPSTAFLDISSSRLGHANKWAAEALLARVFLFYTGYYNKSTIELTDGTSLTKENVISYLVDCIDNSGHDLLDDYRRLWPYSDVPNYTFTQDVSWAGDGNIESIFAIKYSNISEWNNGEERYSNQHSLYVGARFQKLEPFGYGWGAGPVNPALWNSFEEGDLRKDASIINLNDPIPHDSAYASEYEWGKQTMQHETGFMEKKYMPAGEIRNGEWNTIFYWNYGAKNSSEQLTNMQDDILIRFADVLLMAAELGAPEAQTYFDRVRTRAGLASKTVSLEAIKLERRHEFAFEGLRYFDLLRWGIDEAKKAIELANGTIVKNDEIDTEYNVDFRRETGGFIPIPQTEITLSEGVLEQTPGW